MRNETIEITHPCHPFSGLNLAVLHYRPTSSPPSVVVELPDGTARSVPLSWTDRAEPDKHETLLATELGRLSGQGVLEILRLLESWSEEG